MKTYVPEYYPQFHCIAEKCRHSCCVGWEIDIDEESLARFKAVGGEIGRRLAEDIVETEECASFRLKEGDRCPFLNEKGLCDLVIELGEDSLCQICTDHPRYRSFFADRDEMGLGLCCEEAVRIVLNWPEKVRWIVWEDDGFEEELPEEERVLMDVRAALIGIMQRREEPVEKRVENMLEAAGIGWPERSMAQWAQFLLGLERLDGVWTKRLEALCREDGPARDCALPDTPFEQLMVYYLMRHMPGALKDGDMQGRLLLCVLMWKIVRAIAAVERADMEGLADIARMCSSEIEYSDANMEDALYELDELSAQG
ncbi:MAG: flagellin lysine-N-methylase [Clostridia bacterium]|nr:flagellin lysine-N-methylase [Clostridia bacterium]